MRTQESDDVEVGAVFMLGVAIEDVRLQPGYLEYLELFWTTRAMD
jgi:hypothetical protein